MFKSLHESEGEMSSTIEGWTPRDDKQLRELVVEGGSTWEEIGRKLARTPRAVHSRAKKLKISIRHIKWASKPQQAAKI
jgi:hypothetical protein